MVVLIAVLSPACFETPVMAQEVTSVVNDRVDAGVVPDVERVPVATKTSEKRGGWEIGAALSAAYDSNIFLNSSNPVSSMVYRLAPTVAYAIGDPNGLDGAFIQAAYRPTGVVYSKANSESRIDQQAAIHAGWHGKESQITYAGAIQKAGDATADAGRQTDRVEFENELRVAWLPREKVSLELAAGNRRSDYVDPTLYDSSKVYGEAAVRYAYSPKTQMALAYQVGTLKVDGASDQTTQQITGKIEWQPREKIRVALEAGAEHRKTEVDSKVKPVVEARIDWAPREGTGVYLTGYQREEASAYLAGQNYRVKGVTAGIVQRLGGNWSARLEGGRETASYSVVSGSGSGGRNDRIWFLRPALEYKISDQFDVAFFYRASENDSNDANFGFRQKVAGIELNYRF